LKILAKDCQFDGAGADICKSSIVS